LYYQLEHGKAASQRAAGAAAGSTVWTIRDGRIPRGFLRLPAKQGGSATYAVVAVCDASALRGAIGCDIRRADAGVVAR